MLTSPVMLPPRYSPAYERLLQCPSEGTFQGDHLSAPYSTSISQNGVVPNNAPWLCLLASYWQAPDLQAYHLAVSLNGTEIPMNNVSGSQWYAGNVSAFAGQSADLQVSLVVTEPQDEPQYAVGVLLDGIRFSDQPVPEPSTFVLLSIGAISLLAYAWRRRR